MSCTPKTAKRMVLTLFHGRLGNLYPYMLGFTWRVGTSNSIMTLLRLVDSRPAVDVFLGLEKAFELTVMPS